MCLKTYICKLFAHICRGKEATHSFLFSILSGITCMSQTQGALIKDCIGGSAKSVMCIHF